MKMLRILWLAAVTSLSGLGVAYAVPVYDVAADFSFAVGDNPNPPWTFGSKLTLGAALFTPYATQGTLSGVQFWGSLAAPNVGYNPTGAPITFSDTTFLPGQVTLHPGPLNEYSVVRFTAPIAGTYDLTASFNMRAFNGTQGTDVHVRVSNVEVFNPPGLNGFNNSLTYTDTSLTLALNETVDFLVGPAGNQPFASYRGDTTQLMAQLELLAPAANPVPTPGTLMLCALAIPGLGFTLRKRERSRALPAAA